MAVKKKKAATKKKVKAKKKAKSPTKAKPAKTKKKTTPKKKAKAKKTSAKKAVKKKKAPPKRAAPKRAAPKKVVAKKAEPTVAPINAAPKKTAKPPRKTASRKLDPLILKVKEQLVYQRNDLLKMIQSSREVERNVEDLTFSNEIDLASSLEGREMAFQLSSRERNELRMIENALLKMGKGTYGVCESCSKNIPVKRLQIMPLTPLCIDCQENLEVG